MKLIEISIAAMLLVGCSFIEEAIGLNEDCDAEEVIEQVIEEKTGLDLDLTPSSEEIK